MKTTEKDEADTKTLAWLKIIGIVATIAASSIGSYKAASSSAKSEASVSYATMKEAVENLERNQKMMWDMMVSLNSKPVRTFERPAEAAMKPTLQLSPLPTRQPLRPLPRTLEDLVNSPGVPVLNGLSGK